MYSKFQLAKKFINYYIKASNGRGHGVHSPFVFQFITDVLNDSRSFYAYETIERLRKDLMVDQRMLTIEDFGAGSRIIKTKQRKIADVAASSLKPKKYSQLLFRMVGYYNPSVILELGTSLGITTSYLASAKDLARVITMEGSEAVAGIAKENFAKEQLKHIELVLGDFDSTLQPTLNSITTNIDFIFIDGNHRYEPTVRYFKQLLPHVNEQSVIIFDDVHWSEEMEQAWEEIKKHPSVTLTIDLFFIGIVFFRKENKIPQHFTIRF